MPEKINQKEMKDISIMLSRMAKTADALSDRLINGSKGMDGFSKKIPSATRNSKKLNESLEKQSGLFTNLVKAVTKYGKSLIAMTAIVAGVRKVWRTFIAVGSAQKKAMAEIAQQTGASAAQMAMMRKSSEELRKKYAGLVGTIGEADIQASAKDVQELNLAWRNVNEATGKGFASSMLVASRGLGLGMQGAVDLRRTLEGLNVTKTSKDFEAFTGQMVGFADTIGASAGQLMQDFNESRNIISRFGEKGVRVFKDASLMATKFGLSTQKLLQGMTGFDKFGESANKVNELNAVLGTTISAYRLTMEQNPAKRLEIIRKELQDQGTTWETLNHIQKQTLSEAVGLSEEEAQRVFQNKMSLEELRKEQEKAAKAKKLDAQTEKEQRQAAYKLLQRTGQIFDKISESLNKLSRAFARLLSPIFGEINEGLSGWIDKITDFVNKLAGDDKVKEYLIKTKDIVVKIGKKAIPMLIKGVEMVVESFEWWVEVFSDIGNAWEKYVAKPFKFFFGADNVVKRFVDTAKILLLDLGSMIYDSIAGPFQKISSMILGLAEKNSIIGGLLEASGMKEGLEFIASGGNPLEEKKNQIALEMAEERKVEKKMDKGAAYFNTLKEQGVSSSELFGSSPKAKAALRHIMESAPKGVDPKEWIKKIVERSGGEGTGRGSLAEADLGFFTGMIPLEDNTSNFGKMKPRFNMMNHMDRMEKANKKNKPKETSERNKKTKSDHVTNVTLLMDNDVIAKKSFLNSNQD